VGVHGLCLAQQIELQKKAMIEHFGGINGCVTALFENGHDGNSITNHKAM
jgi:hypothetical protein